LKTVFAFVLNSNRDCSCIYCAVYILISYGKFTLLKMSHRRPPSLPPAAGVRVRPASSTAGSMGGGRAGVGRRGGLVRLVVAGTGSAGDGVKR